MQTTFSLPPVDILYNFKNQPVALTIKYPKVKSDFNNPFLKVKKKQSSKNLHPAKQWAVAHTDKGSQTKRSIKYSLDIWILWFWILDFDTFIYLRFIKGKTQPLSPSTGLPSCIGFPLCVNFHIN